MGELVDALATGSLARIDLQDPIRDYLDSVGFFAQETTPELPELPFRPTVATLLLTRRCNLRCTYCYADGGQGEALDLSWEAARSAIDLVHRNAVALGRGRFSVDLHGGGEPMQVWDLVKRIEHYARCKDLRCHVSMMTNGVLSGEQRRWLLHHLDSVGISFDGLPETQNRQRPLASGGASTDLVMETLAMLDQAEFPYGIRMTALPPFDVLQEDVRFICEQTECHRIQVEPAFAELRGGHRSPTHVEADAFASGFLAALRVARGHQRELFYSGARLGAVSTLFCSAPYDALVLSPRGEIVACYEMTDSSQQSGHLPVFGHWDMAETIDTQDRRECLVQDLLARRQLCEDCFCYWHCAGDCLARTQSSLKNVKSSPRCLMNQRIARELLLLRIADGDGLWRGSRAIDDGACF